jgi:hypothetical protein
MARRVDRATPGPCQPAAMTSRRLVLPAHRHLPPGRCAQDGVVGVHALLLRLGLRLEPRLVRSLAENRRVSHRLKQGPFLDSFDSSLVVIVQGLAWQSITDQCTLHAYSRIKPHQVLVLGADLAVARLLRRLDRRPPFSHHRPRQALAVEHHRAEVAVDRCHLPRPCTIACLFERPFSDVPAAWARDTAQKVSKHSSVGPSTGVCLCLRSVPYNPL